MSKSVFLKKIICRSPFRLQNVYSSAILINIMKEFSIEYNPTVVPESNKCLFMDISLPELSPLRRAGIKCLSFVHWLGHWMIERNGNSQERHLDFYWFFGDGFSMESVDGILHARPGDFLAVPSWFDRRQTIISEYCPHIYFRSDAVDDFSHFQQIILRKSILSDEFQSDFIRLARSCNPLNYEKILLSPLAELVAAQFKKEIGYNDSAGERFRERFFSILNRTPAGVSVPELAEQLCMSESGLYKKCMQFLHASPGKLLAEHRLQNARQYLLLGNYPLRQVARMSGYCDEFAFSKAFRNCFGISPSEYREKNSLR